MNGCLPAHQAHQAYSCLPQAWQRLELLGRRQWTPASLIICRCQPSHVVSTTCSSTNSNTHQAAAPLLVQVLSPESTLQQQEYHGWDAPVQHNCVGTSHPHHQHVARTAQLHMPDGPLTPSKTSHSSSLTSNRSHSPSNSSSSSTAVEPLKFLITRNIKSCTCWQELDVLVREYGPAFNIIHISAAVTHLAQLTNRAAPRQQQMHGLQLVREQMGQQHQELHANSTNSLQQQQQLLHALLAQAVPCLAEARSRQVANMMWAAAHLHYPWQTSKEAGAIAVALADRAAELFETAEAQHLSNMAYAAARLQLPVSQKWVQALQDAWLHLCHQEQQQQQQHLELGHTAQAKCSSHGSRASSSSSSSYGVSCARQNQLCLQASSSQLDLAGPAQLSLQGAAGAGISPQAAANLVWALVQLQQQGLQQPNVTWLQQLVQCLAADLVRWPAASVAVFLWGCARLGYRIPREQRQQQQCMAACPGQQLQEQQQQDQHIQQHWFAAALQGSSMFSCQDVSQTLWAAAVMGVQLSRPNIWQLLAAGARQVTRQLQQQQQQRWVRSSCTASASTAHSVSLVLWSLVQLCQQPHHHIPRQLLRPWLAALLASSAAADGHSLATAAWALCRLQLAGQCPVLVQALLASATQQLQQQQATVAPGPAAAAAAVHDPVVTGRAAATLLWAAAICVPSETAQQAGSQHMQQLPSSSSHKQQEQHVLRERQQQRLHHMISSIRATQQAAGSGGVVQTAAEGLLLRLARLQQQQPQQQPKQQQQQQKQQQDPQQELQLAHPRQLLVLPGGCLRDVAQVLWAVQRLQLQLPRQWWQQCLVQLQELLDLEEAAADGQSLAVAAWSLGRARVLVPTQLMRQLQQASLPLLHKQERSQPETLLQKDGQQLLQQHGSLLSPQSHVVLLVGLVSLCATAAHQLPKHSRCKEQQQCEEQQLEHQQHPQQQQQGSSACLPRPPLPASERIHPQQPHYRWVMLAGLQAEWLQAYCQSVARQMHLMTPSGLVALAWCLGKLRYHPGSQFVAALLQQAEKLLPELSARHIAVLLWSLLRLQHVPEERLLDDLMHTWEQRLASANKADSQQVQWVQQQLRQLELEQQQQQQRQQQQHSIGQE